MDIFILELKKNNISVLWNEKRTSSELSEVKDIILWSPKTQQMDKTETTEQSMSQLQKC